MTGEEDLRAVDIEAAFRHSAGTLGSRFFAALRDEARLLGWRTGGLVLVPPRDLGLPGEWVEIGPGGTLEAYAPTDWLADLGIADADGSSLALVRLDGADSALLARLRPGAAMGALRVGQNVFVHFAEERHGAMTDFWFEPGAD